MSGSRPAAETVGDVLLRCEFDPLDGSRLFVDRADPVALIGEEMLAEAAAGDPELVALVDDVLTIRAENRTVVYVVDRDSYDPQARTYLMRWPDL